MAATAERVHAVIAAVCPIVGVSIRTGNVVDISYDVAAQGDSEEAVALRTAAAAALAEFDWSDEAEASWQLQKRRQLAVDIINSSDPIMVSQRALAYLVRQRVSALLVALGRTPLSMPDLVSAWADIIASGLVDDGLPEN